MNLAGNTEEREGLLARWSAKSKLPACKCAMQPREQSSLGHGLSPRTLRHVTS